MGREETKPLYPVGLGAEAGQLHMLIVNATRKAKGLEAGVGVGGGKVEPETGRTGDANKGEDFLTGFPLFPVRRALSSC